eukprot:comp11541_c0_seq2/m.5997 comp11541_c0_seq2/g.5997  ORF comp11541_c0_seq2/g.5997 comp11541_c0_seq2/m.5997 type:complete len:207 (-) comp11541_c0_seq2:185-805(-)
MLLRLFSHSNPYYYLLECSFFPFSFRTDPEKKADVEKLEQMAIRFFTYFEGREREHAKLSTSEFELKSIVDDILVRLLYPDAEPHYEKGEPLTTPPPALEAPTASTYDPEGEQPKPADPTQSMLTVDAKTLMKRSPKKKPPPGEGVGGNLSSSAPSSPNLSAKREDGGSHSVGIESLGHGILSSPPVVQRTPGGRNVTPFARLPSS